MHTLLITGANRGIGLEAAAQLASLGNFDRIILTARTAEKGETAVKAALAQATLQPGRNFSFAVQVLDLESHASVRAAVKALPKLDGVVLNAGGLLGEELTAHGVTQSFAANVLGHAVLLEGLLAANKIRDGARVIYSHSETTRSVWLFAGFQPFVRLYASEIEGSIVSPPTRGTLGIPPRQRMNTYANSKLIGGLWIATLAKEHPNVYFASVSPGGCGDTDTYAAAPWPFPQVMGMPIVVRTMVAMGACHSLASAASRYVRALTDESFPRRFASGAVVGGPYIFYANGEDGELYDQSAFSSYYGDEELQAEATRVVRTAAMR